MDLTDQSLARRLMASRGNITTVVCLSGIAMIAAALRFFALGREPAWLDEAATWHFSQLPLHVLWYRPVDDQPPLYYTIVHEVVNLGGSPWLLRLPSAVFGTLAVLPAYILGRHVSGNRSGLIAALLVASTPLQIHYSQDARAYAMLGTAILCASAGFVVFFSQESTATSRTAGAFLWLFSAVISLYLHNISAIFIAEVIALGCVVAVARRSVNICITWISLNAVILFMWSWWIPIIIEQLTNGVPYLAWLPPPNLHAALNGLGAIYGEYYSFYGRKPIDIALLVLGLIGLYACRRQNVILLFFAVTVFAIPLVEITISLIGRPVFMVRTIAWVGPLFLILIAVAITSLPRKVGLPVFCMVMLVQAVSVWNYFLVFNNEPWDELSSALASNLCTSDAVVFIPWPTRWPVHYYMHNIIDQINAIGLSPAGRLDVAPEVHAGWSIGTIQSEEKNITKSRRVWTVYRKDRISAQLYSSVKSVLSGYAELQQLRFAGLQLALFSRSSGKVATCDPVTN